MTVERKIFYVACKPEPIGSIGEAIRKARDGGYIVIVEGDYIVLKVEDFKESVEDSREETIINKDVKTSYTTSLSSQKYQAKSKKIALVFDQMFRGFAEILTREVPIVEAHEIVGRGLHSPIKAGAITKWPANDDFDVIKVVENLSREKDKVVFFTGDKRLARQAEALALENLRVEYMPPNEFPGKESIAKAMIRVAREELESTS